jgi:hypothetical protein
LAAVGVLAACFNKHDAVVRTSAAATDPWKCSEDKTLVSEVSHDRYRLEGCGASAVYACDFAMVGPKCWKDAK